MADIDLTATTEDGARGAGAMLLPLSESPVTRGVLIAVALAFLVLFLILPLMVVFTEAFESGVGTYFAAHWPSRRRSPRSA